MTKIFTLEENRAWQRTLPGKKSSACIAIVRDGKVLMVKASYKDYWTFPSGVVDEGESPLDAAIRETHEEVGLLLDREDVTFLTVVYTYPKNGFQDRFNFVYFTDVVDVDVKLVLQESEIEAAQWVPVNEIASLANQRGSYQNIQRLLETQVKEFYLEVR